MNHEQLNTWFSQSFANHFKALAPERELKLVERLMNGLDEHHFQPIFTQVQAALDDVAARFTKEREHLSGEISALTNLLVDVSAELAELRQRIEMLELREDA